MIRHVRAVAARDASGLVAAVYEEVRREFGALVPPFTLHSPAPQLLAGAWRACRATLVTGRVRRAVKEAVAIGVSRANRCTYCVDAHTVMLEGADARDAARAIAASRDADIADPELREATAWGAASAAAATATGPAAFAREDAPEILGTALVFHYINRLVTVLLGDSPLPASRHWRGAARRGGAWWFGRAIARAKASEPPPLLAAAPLPVDLAWAGVSPAVGDALARWVAAVEHAGAEVLPAPTRAAVVARVDAWSGEDLGLGRSWLAPVLEAVDERSRPAARLALLTALAPHQVGSDVVAAFRVADPGDEALLAVLAWSALVAARRVLRWVPMDPA